MKPASQAVSDLVITALDLNPDFDSYSVFPGWNEDEMEKPCVVVDLEELDANHSRRRNLELSVYLLASRHDNAPGIFHGMQEKILEHFEAAAFALAEGLYAEEWKLSAFALTAPIDQLEGEQEWRSGYEFRLVLIQV